MGGKFSSKIHPDELFRVTPLNATGSATEDDGTGGSGGSISSPEPFNFPWGVQAYEDDDHRDGLYAVVSFRVPSETRRFKFKYAYVKKNGTYGKEKWSRAIVLTDAQRMATASYGVVEFPFGPLRPNARLDILRLVAIFSRDDEAKNPAEGVAENATPVTAGTTGSYPWHPVSAPFSDTGTHPSGVGDSFLSGLATIITRNYFTGQIRVLAVGTAKKEVDGIYYPVTVGVAPAGQAEYLQSIRFGVHRVGTKAGGSGVYSRRIPLPRIDLTDTDRTTLGSTNSLELDVGPFRQKKVYDILWARGRFGFDSDSRITKRRYPEADADIATTPTDTSPANSKNVAGTVLTTVPGNSDTTLPGYRAALNVGGGAMLGCLNGPSRITDAPSDPSAADIIVNELDISTEKASDCLVSPRVWANQAHTKTFADTNAERMMAVFCPTDKLGPGEANYYKKIKVDVEDETATSLVLPPFRRKEGKPMTWIKNVAIIPGLDRLPSTGPSYGFRVGGNSGSGYVETDALSKISGFTLSSAASDDDNDNHAITATVTATATSGNYPLYKRLVVFVNRKGTAPFGTVPTSIDGDTNWKVAQDIRLRGDAKYHGASVTIRVSVPARRKRTIYVCAAITAVGATSVPSGNSITGPPPAKVSNILAVTTESQLPPGNYAHGNGNMIRGGSMNLALSEINVGGDDLKPARQWFWHAGALPTTGNPSTVLTDIDTGTTDRVNWRKANQCLYFYDTGTADGGNVSAVHRLRRGIKPGEILSLSRLVGSDSLLGLTNSYSFDAVLMHAYETSFGSGTWTWQVLATFEPTPNMAPPILGWKMIGNTSTPVINFNKYRGSRFYIFIRKITSTTNLFFRATNFMLVRGSQYLPWDASAEELDWGLDDAGAGFSNVTYNETNGGGFGMDQGGNWYNTASGEVDFLEYVT